MWTRESGYGVALVAATLTLVTSAPVASQDRPSSPPAAGPALEHPTAPPFVPMSLIRHKGAQTAVRRAAEGAVQRLERPECEAVFSDFTDKAGRPLAASLQALGQSGSAFFRTIVYADGAGLARCNDQGLVALTVPGSRVVFVCGRQFARDAFARPLHAEAVLIHEALHSLGLGEDPPSALEITSRVVARCIP